MNSSSVSVEVDQWNVEERKTKTKSATCVYKQVYQINPLMGGFSALADTYQKSDFKVYQFTGDYKIGASNNNVVLTTASACSQMSVSFDRGLVVFQQKVVPQKASVSAKCQQEVVFNENKYTIVISPFEQHLIDIGTMILAVNGELLFTTFKLPSRTDQDKISKALYDYLMPMPMTNINTKQITPMTINLVPVPTSGLTTYSTSFLLRGGSTDGLGGADTLINVQYTKYTNNSQIIVISNPRIVMPANIDPDFQLRFNGYSISQDGYNIESNNPTVAFEINSPEMAFVRIFCEQKSLNSGWPVAAIGTLPFPLGSPPVSTASINKVSQG